ncbi:MAG: 50S ribosomal protein L24 [Puniceicoccales bacterium]|jgi:large subunit ribosomal protein L24|nr:50S ribosomal protein L24 [Puniceicoccales bacterium]
MSKPTIKKGDTVIVIAGKNKGQTGEVLEVLPQKFDKTKAGLDRPRTGTGIRYIIAGVNIAKHHTKKQGNQEGGILKEEAPLTASKIALLKTYKGKKPTKETPAEEKPATKTKKSKKEAE